MTRPVNIEPRTILVTVVGLLVACGDAPVVKRAYEPRPLVSLDEYRRCERDDQCVWVNNGCCDCANGGEDIAVRSDKKAAFRALFQCEGTPCTAVGAIPACGAGTVACETGLCVYRPPPE